MPDLGLTGEEICRHSVTSGPVNHPDVLSGFVDVERFRRV